MTGKETPSHQAPVDIRIRVIALFRAFIFTSGIVFIILIIIFSALFLFFRSYDQYEIDSTVKSPDGEFVATLYANFGGGGPGYCESRVSVTPSSMPFSRKMDKYAVFESHCNEKIKMIWKTKDWLIIDINSLDFSRETYLYVKEKDRSGKVKISFSHKEFIRSSK